MARKKKTEPVEIAQEEPRQVARKKPDYMIAVTEEEYDAHREELEKLGNVLVCVDELDRDIVRRRVHDAGKLGHDAAAGGYL